MPETNALWVRASALAVLLAVLGAWFWIEASVPPREAPPSGQAIAIDKSAHTEAARKAAIEKVIQDGLVRRIEPGRGGTLRVSLRPAFYLLDEGKRHEYVDLIYRHYFDGSSVNDTVVLRDARHGNEVGQFNPYKGGLKMYK